MADSGFDIKSLVGFNPPVYRCKACLALLSELDFYAMVRKTPDVRCPACQTLYVFAEGADHWRLARDMQFEGFAVKYHDLIEHAKELAYTAWAFHEVPETYPPLKTLMEALSQAKNFVHFTTYGINQIFVGVFKMVAQRVPVCGIVSNVEEGLADELTGHTDEAPHLQVKTFMKGFNRNAPPEGWDEIPHQKLVVIDGLLAFKGSANLNVRAWRKAAEGREQIEIETNVMKVMELNNRYFSPIWYELNGKPPQVLVASRRLSG